MVNDDLAIAPNETYVYRNVVLPITSYWWKSYPFASYGQLNSNLVSPIVIQMIESTDENEWINSSNKLRLSFRYNGTGTLTYVRINCLVVGVSQ